MSYVIVADWTAEPGAEEIVLDVARTMSALTPTEPGNEAFDAHQDAADPRRFVLVERYRDEAAFEDHKASAHYREHVVGRALPNLSHRAVRVLTPTTADADGPAGTGSIPRPAGPAFRAAVEVGDIDTAIGLLADDVVFRSPAVFTPYRGAAAAGHLLRTVFDVFEDFRYEQELASQDAHALVFRARVGDRRLEGVDFVHSDAQGRIAEFTVMVRPASGLAALVAAMDSRLGGVESDEA